MWDQIFQKKMNWMIINSADLGRIDVKFLKYAQGHESVKSQFGKSVKIRKNSLNSIFRQFGLILSGKSGHDRSLIVL